MSSPERARPPRGASLDPRAQALARDIVERLQSGEIDALGPDAMQALAAALCRAYAASQEAGAGFPILARRDAASGTDVMIMCSALLKAVDLQVFELGMWSSWTGR